MSGLTRRERNAKLFLALASNAIAAVIIVLVLLQPEVAEKLRQWQQQVVARFFAHWMIWGVSLMTLFCVVLALSPIGRVRLGRDGETPEYNTFSWFAMLFSAGIGTGILFWGVAEPMYHIQGNPFIDMAGAEPLSERAGQIALRVTLFHWGLHGWAAYICVGLCLAYFCYRQGLPLTVRSALYPLLGERIYGPAGLVIDLLAIFATLFGITISLGLGASQIASGLNYLFGLEPSNALKLGLILLVSLIATLSAVLGVSRGIRRLSEINIWLSVALICTLLAIGPTLFILKLFFSESFQYFYRFIPMGLWVDPEPVGSWQSSWTLFYWGWWIAWAPFVGMFIARVSRGRTIRQFVLGALLAPVIASFLWLSVFGGTALDLQLNQSADLITAVNSDMARALFTTYELMDLGTLSWFFGAITTLLIISWFATSSDSGTLVICTIISLGTGRPTNWLRISWGMTIGLVAGLLLIAGGLSALQAASTIVAVPFAGVIFLMMAGLTLALWRTERKDSLGGSGTRTEVSTASRPDQRP
ncbi:MAG: BCCT family transporter [Xanthomonadales bacterium]|nr:BCCT family transporter [Xanthomonadales bacterium]NIN58387.1 BCCT family transporter [Xanthomonadales bacterium]NIO14522.1 BCCT family transporter [Xanthomonadales bacterium]NIP10780.1 BCCT family transporter [Xanthomonadales bacterium]NIP76845.1 BCCT family transporter [Xanthomonadales bacterium]